MGREEEEEEEEKEKEEEALRSGRLSLLAYAMIRFDAMRLMMTRRYLFCGYG